MPRETSVLLEENPVSIKEKSDSTDDKSDLLKEKHGLLTDKSDLLDEKSKSWIDGSDEDEEVDRKTGGELRSFSAAYNMPSNYIRVRKDNEITNEDGEVSDHYLQ